MYVKVATKFNEASVEPRIRLWKLLNAVALLVLLFNISVFGQSRPGFKYPEPQSSDYIAESMPLWGGGHLLKSQIQSTVPREFKLHHFDNKQCGDCHNFPSASATPGTNKGLWKTGVDINQSCSSSDCHEYESSMNHPMGFSAKIATQGGRGEITCLTCHGSEQAAGADNGEERSLHTPDEGICQSCHGRLAGSLKQRSHCKFSTKAHLVNLTPGNVSDKTSGGLTASGIDSESRDCVTCHDEISITIPGFNESRREKAERYKNMSDHPIGMDYQQNLSVNRMYFNELSGEGDKIRLFDGKIGCGSCHSLYSQTASNLVIEYKGAKLCRTCHNR